MTRWLQVQMGRRLWRYAGGVIAAFLGGACVDLFHATDFDTLCTLNPAACVADAAITVNDASAPPDAQPDATPPLDFCAWSQAEALSHAERACGWVGACQGALEQSSFGACMIRALAAYDCKYNPSLRPRGASRAVWTCLADVASCGGVSSCLFGASAPVCSPVDAGSFTACTADSPSSTVVECGTGGSVHPPVAIEPCVLEGRACATVDPSTALCAGRKGVACSGPTTCDGTHAVECASTTDVGLDCAAFGAGRCVQDDAGVACAPVDDAGSCTESSATACDDAGVAHRCAAGRVVTIDCNSIGQPCVAVPSAIDPTKACANTSPSGCKGPDECVGDILRSCGQGRTFEVSCGALGLGPCAKPASGGPFATCTLP